MFDRSRLRDHDDERRTASAPPTRLSGVLALQRSAGNAALARMLTPHGRSLARVGETKVGVAEGEGSDVKTVELLKEALKDIADADRAGKDAFERDKLETMPKGKEKPKEQERRKVLEEYQGKLNTGDRLERLQSNAKFIAAKLKLGAYTKDSTSVDVLDEGGKVVAKLVVGRANFVPKPVAPKAEKPVVAEGEKADAPTEVKADAPTEVKTDAPTEVKADAPTEVKTDAPKEVKADAPTEVKADAPTEVKADAPKEEMADAPAEETRPPRDLKTRIGKPQKEYVEDDRDVPTRRFAYMEKSFYQFMEFLATGSMTGRYQTWNKALSLAPDLKAIAPYLSFQLSPDPSKPVTTLSPEQMAFLHQWKGSGPQQRGLSLTSTPREKAVYANAGESFRTADGVRIKIDLSLVPKEVILLNHYSQGGVKDNTGVKPDIPYGYDASVRKNRELYLERLDPQWIVGIDAHLPSLPPMSTEDKAKSGADLVEAMRKQIGYDGYKDAFDKTVTALKAKKEADVPAVKGDDDPFTKGVNSGRNYMAGHDAGKTEFAKFKEVVRATSALLAGSEAAEAKLAERAKQQKREKQKASKLIKAGKTPPAKTSLTSEQQLTEWATVYAYNQVKDLGKGTVEVDEWTAMTFMSSQREKYDIYWIGWAHGAKGKAPQPMDKTFHDGTTTIV
jgi:hypothetical protein